MCGVCIDMSAKHQHVVVFRLPQDEQRLQKPDEEQLLQRGLRGQPLEAAERQEDFPQVKDVIHGRVGCNTSVGGVLTCYGHIARFHALSGVSWLMS